MLKLIAAAICGLGLSGCATPVTLLKHSQTGQVVTCGGGVGGSMLGGVAGYHIEESLDRKCEANFMSQGFEVMRPVPK